MINFSDLSPAGVLATVGDAKAQKRMAENFQLIMAARRAEFCPGESIDSHQPKISGGDRAIHH